MTIDNETYNKGLRAACRFMEKREEIEYCEIVDPDEYGYAFDLIAREWDGSIHFIYFTIDEHDFVSNDAIDRNTAESVRAMCEEDAYEYIMNEGFDKIVPGSSAHIHFDRIDLCVVSDSGAILRLTHDIINEK